MRIPGNTCQYLGLPAGPGQGRGRGGRGAQDPAPARADRHRARHQEPVPDQAEAAAADLPGGPADTTGLAGRRGGGDSRGPRLELALPYWRLSAQLNTNVNFCKEKRKKKYIASMSSLNMKYSKNVRRSYSRL